MWDFFEVYCVVNLFFFVGEIFIVNVGSKVIISFGVYIVKI